MTLTSPCKCFPLTVSVTASLLLIFSDYRVLGSFSGSQLPLSGEKSV